MKAGFKYLTLLLVAILLTKVSAFHAYEEHDAVEEPGTHCELCVLAVEGLQLEGIQPAPIVVSKAPVTTLFIPKRFFAQQTSAIQGEAGQLFSRPPPAPGA